MYVRVLCSDFSCCKHMYFFAAVIAAAAARRTASALGMPRSGSSSALSSGGASSAHSSRDGAGVQSAGSRDGAGGRASRPGVALVARPDVPPGIVQKMAPTDSEMLEAAEFGQAGRLNKLLLRPDANLNCKDSVRAGGTTVRVHAAGCAMTLAAAQMGLTPVMWAARNGHNAILRTLAGRGADLKLGDAVVRARDSALVDSRLHNGCT